MTWEDGQVFEWPEPIGAWWEPNPTLPDVPGGFRYSLAWTEGAWWAPIHETIAYHEWHLRNARRLRRGNIMRSKVRRLLYRRAK